MDAAAVLAPSTGQERAAPLPSPAEMPSRAWREEHAGRLVQALVCREVGEGALGAEGERFLALELAGAAAALRYPAPDPGEEVPPPVSHPPALLLRDFLASPRPLPELEALASSLLRSILGEPLEPGDWEGGRGAPALPEAALDEAVSGFSYLQTEFPMFEDRTLEAAWQGAQYSLEGARAALLELFEADPVAALRQDLPLDEANFPGLGGDDHEVGAGRGTQGSRKTAPEQASAASTSPPSAGSGPGGSWASTARAPPAVGPTEGAAATPGQARHKGLPQKSLASAYRGGHPGGGSSAGVGRVSTGATVAQDYAQAREEAAQHARARNACFEGATRAFQAGNKAAAKELGRKGRWHNEKMKALHEAAARDTFRRRNSGGGAVTRGGHRVIDLHGLHVVEAVRFLAEELEGQGRGRCLFVVVGTGHHSHYTQKRDVYSSAGGTNIAPRLAAAVEALLTERGLPFSSPEAGLLQVTL